MCTAELGVKSPWFGNILVVQTNQSGEVTDIDEEDEVQARDVLIEYVDPLSILYILNSYCFLFSPFSSYCSSCPF